MDFHTDSYNQGSDIRMKVSDTDSYREGFDIRTDTRTQESGNYMREFGSYTEGFDIRTDIGMSSNLIGCSRRIGNNTMTGCSKWIERKEFGTDIDIDIRTHRQESGSYTEGFGTDTDIRRQES